MRIRAFCKDEQIYDKTVPSVGGGAIETVGEAKTEGDILYPQNSFAEIEALCEEKRITLPEYAEWCEGKEIREYMRLVWQRNNLPKAVVEVINPIALSANLVNKDDCCCCNGKQSVRAVQHNPFSFDEFFPPQKGCDGFDNLKNPGGCGCGCGCP